MKAARREARRRTRATRLPRRIDLHFRELSPWLSDFSSFFVVEGQHWVENVSLLASQIPSQRIPLPSFRWPRLSLSFYLARSSIRPYHRPPPFFTLLLRSFRAFNPVFSLFFSLSFLRPDVVGQLLRLVRAFTFFQLAPTRLLVRSSIRETRAKKIAAP